MLIVPYWQLKTTSGILASRRSDFMYLAITKLREIYMAS